FPPRVGAAAWSSRAACTMFARFWVIEVCIAAVISARKSASVLSRHPASPARAQHAAGNRVRVLTVLAGLCPRPVAGERRTLFTVPLKSNRAGRVKREPVQRSAARSLHWASFTGRKFQQG